MRTAKTVAVLVTSLLAASVLLVSPPAGSAPRVGIDNGAGKAVIDATYTTTLTLHGRGFQSIKNGYGGIYVLFGVVKGTWQPSKGGTSGGSYLTVPDSETRNNAGYAKFIAFPGSETSSSANGGLIKADGTWTTTLSVPGGTFSTLDSNQKVVKVDCKVSTCGVITIGAHGVSNGRNETFTPVTVGKVAGAEKSAAATTTTGGTTTGTSGATTGTPTTTGSTGAVQPPKVVGPPALEVDRASAKPGRVLSFSGTGLVAGSQVTATFEDGEAAVGPLTVGASGQVAGVLRLPTDLQTGTYELRLVGGEELPSVRFAVVADRAPATGHSDGPWPVVFVIASAAVLVGAVAFAGVRRFRGRRAV